jgi:RNA polymerase sigma-70 factor (ECF subfamily)
MASNVDKDLVIRALAGDATAFGQLVETYEERIHVLVAHSGIGAGDVDDVVQDAFVLAYRRLGTLKKPESFGSWLYKTALRLSSERRAKRSPVALPLEDVPATGAPTPDSDLASAETRAAVRAAVASLDEHYRATVMLRYFENMSCDDIAEHLDEPAGTVRTRLHRASAILRDKLGLLARSASGGTP